MAIDKGKEIAHIEDEGRPCSSGLKIAPFHGGVPESSPEPSHVPTCPSYPVGTVASKERSKDAMDTEVRHLPHYGSCLENKKL